MDNVKAYLDGTYHRGFVDVTYDDYRKCKEEKGEENYCRGICRCTKIKNVQIQSIDINGIMNSIYTSINPNKSLLTQEQLIMLYCIDRIFRCRSLYASHCWDYKVSMGYYGEEFDGCFIKPDKLQELFKDLDNIGKLNKDDRIRYVLNLEYGYLLKSLEQSKFIAKKIPRNQIKLGNEDHYTKVKVQVLDTYSPKVYKLPVCVCSQLNPNEYKIIDGYHRMAAHKDQENVMVILAL